MRSPERTKAQLLDEIKALRACLGEQERARARLEEIVKELAADQADAAQRPGLAGDRQAPPDALAQSLQELQCAYEELQVAEEELRLQNEELAAARETTEKEHHRYQDLFDSAPDGYLVTDASGVIHEANQIAEAMLNFPRIFLSGKPLAVFIAPEQRKEFMSRLSTIKRSDASLKWELRIQPRGRNSFPAEVTVAQSRDLSGRSGNVRWLIHDITERKQAEEALHEAKETAERRAAELKTVFDAMSDHVYIYDAKGTLLQTNAAVKEFLGMNPEGMVREKHDELFQAVVQRPVNGKPVRPENRPIARALQGKIVRDEPYVVKDSAGRERVLAIWCSPIISDGNIIGAVTVGHDNTERLQAELALKGIAEKYSTLFNTTSDGIFIKSLNGEILEVNDAYCEMSGYSRDELLGMSVSTLEAVDSPDEIAAHTKKLLKTGGHGRFESRHRRRDGSLFDVDITALYFEEDSGRIAVFLRDITQRKEAERESEEEKREIELSNRILQVFIEETGDDLYDKVLNIILDATESRQGVFGYMDEDGVLVCPTMSKVFDQCKMEEKCICYTPETWKGLWGRALREKRTLYSNKPMTVPPGHVPIRNNMATPVLFRDSVIGLINLANKENDYSEEDQKFLESVSRRIAPVLYAQIQKELRETERKKAEAGLRESEQRFRKVFENAATGIAITDCEGRFQQCNPAYCSLLGYAEEELCHVEVASLIHPEDRDANMAEIRRLQSGDLPFFEIENRYVRKDGQSIWVRKFVSVLPDEPGKPARLMALVTDITERKRAEEELARQRELLQSIFDNIPVMLVLWDSQLQHFSLNRYAEAVLGWKDADVTSGDFLSKVYPDLAYRAQVAAHMRSLKSGWREWNATTKDGERVPSDWANIRLADNRMIGIGVDLTERKQSEARIKRQSAVLDGINRIFQETLRCETDADIARVFLKVAEDITGSRFGLVGEMNEEGMFDDIALSDPGWVECTMPDSDRTKLTTGMKVRGYWAKALVEGRSVIVNDPDNHPDRVDVPEGRPPITSFLGTPLTLGGKTLGMIALANRPGGYTTENQQDVEALAVAFVEALYRKRAEKAIHKSEERFRNLSKHLEEAVRRKTIELLQAERLAAVGQMVATVAHEMRNPIHVIMTAVEALRLGSADEKFRQEIFAEIEYGARMVESTIGELLQYVRPLKLEFVPVPVQEVVEGALKLLAHKIKRVNARIQFESGDEKINVDAVKFTQALANIISNAADAMPNGGDLSVCSRALQHDGARFLEISITDTGHGIDEKHMADIFKPFFTTKTRGTGLGLPLCKKIVDAHQGTIIVKSKDGEGTTVELALPLT